MKVKTLLEALKGIDENLNIRVGVVDEKNEIASVFTTVEVSLDGPSLSIFSYSSPITPEDRKVAATIYPLVGIKVLATDQQIRARGAIGLAQFPSKEKVAGSIPAAPTIFNREVTNVKSYDEIILNYAEPMIKSIQKFAEILEKEPDVETHKGKKSLLLFLNDIVDNFSILRDGSFDTPEYEVPSVSVDGSLGDTSVTTEELGDVSSEDFENELREQGINPDEFDDIDDDEEDEEEYYDDEFDGA